MKYQSLMANCLLTNPASVQMAIDGQNIESSILLASAPYASVNDNEVKVEDSELKSKYDEQKARFEQYVESRDIKYVDFQVLPSKADRDALMGRMKEAANGLQNGEDVATVVRKGQSLIPYTGVAVTRNALPRDIAARIDSMAVGQTSQPFETVSDNTLNVVKFISKTQLPDSVEYRQINVGGQTVEEANKRADSIYNALVAGADFEVLAKKYGQTGQKQWLTSNMYEQSTSFDSDTKNYLEVLSTTAEGTIKNVNFAQGNAIVQVTSRRAMVDKYLLAVVKHTIDFSKATYSAAYNKFSQFVSESQTLEALEKNAAKYGYQVLERKDMFNSEHFVAGIRGTRDALKWVFEAKEGNLSPLYECGNNDHLMVVAITKIHPVGFRALDDVKDILKSEVMKDKKFAKLSEKYGAVKSIADAKAKGMQIDTVNQITFSAPAFIQATGSSEPALSGAVVATKQGKFSAHLVKGSAGAYLFEVLKQAERPNALKNVKSTEAQLQQQAMQVVMSRFMNELYTKAKVVDHRYLFF